MTSTAVVVQHVPHEGPGWLDEVLAGAGIAVDVRRMYDGAELPSLAGVDALVVLGGPMGANDDERVSWLTATKHLLAAAVAAELPTLGICLGAQLLAVACGGVVAKGLAGPELGLGTVQLCNETAHDPLFHGVGAEVRTVQWHWDHIEELPPGAVLVAASTAYRHQAFRLGDRAWGLQFHPEVTLPLVAQWAQDDATGVREAGFDPATLVGAVADAEPELLATWSPVLERFAALIG